MSGFARFYILSLIALCSSIAALAVSMYLPALHLLEDSFKTSYNLVQLSFSSFLISFAFGFHLHLGSLYMVL